MNSVDPCLGSSTDNRSDSQPSFAESWQPGRIVSLLDMILKVMIEKVARTYANLIEINTDIGKGQYAQEGDLRQLVGERFAGDPKAGLVATRCFAGFSEAFSDLKEAFDQGYNDDALRTRLRDMEAVLRYDLKQPRFYVLPIDATIHLEPSAVPSVIRNAFENVVFDLEQANRSLAFGLNTACVYHCMCALDYFITFMRGRLAILAGDEVEGHTDQSWKNAIDVLEKRIRELGMQPKTPEVKAEISELAPLCAHMMAVKGAWRNDTMHAKSRFDEGTANDILKETTIVLKYVAEKYAPEKPEVTL